MRKPHHGFKTFTPAERAEYARLGGLAVAEDREFMSKIGKIGGAKVSADREHMSRIGKLGAAARLKKKLRTQGVTQEPS